LRISLAGRLNVFNKTWETVNKRFFDPHFNGVDWAQMKARYRPLVEVATDKNQLRDVLTMMVNELHVSHMNVHGGFRWSYGVALTQIEGKWVVQSTASDSAAQREGIKRGWILTSAEVECLDPKRKVSVRLLDLQEQTRSVDLPCGSYAFYRSVPGIRRLDGDAFYLLGESLADQAARVRSASAIVLDLRANSGGPIADLEKILNLFFSEKTVIGTFRNREGKETTLKTSGSKSAFRGRLIVLIDGDTASAAEIFARAVQETGRGLVVGQPSRGAVLAATNYPLPNGFDVGIAIMDYHTAKGIRLEGRGVQPDEVVGLTVKDFRENKDPVLDRARDLLQRQ
jgi:carboxyl-terminal processing protease